MDAYPPPLENERSHYVVPGTGPSPANNHSRAGQVDAILYRSREKGEVTLAVSPAEEGGCLSGRPGCPCKIVRRAPPPILS